MATGNDLSIDDVVFFRGDRPRWALLPCSISFSRESIPVDSSSLKPLTIFVVCSRQPSKQPPGYI